MHVDTQLVTHGSFRSERSDVRATTKKNLGPLCENAKELSRGEAGWNIGLLAAVGRETTFPTSLRASVVKSVR